MFKVIGCSTMGKYHIGDHNVFIGKNNQDAYSIKESENAIVGIICDGCGSLPYSEFGATLGSQFLSQNISEKIETTHKIVTNNCVFMNWPELILQATDELLIKGASFVLALASKSAAILGPAQPLNANNNINKSKYVYFIINGFLVFFIRLLLADNDSMFKPVNIF